MIFWHKINQLKAKWETSASVTNEQGVSKTIFKNSMLEMYKGRVLLNFINFYDKKLSSIKMVKATYGQLGF